MISKPVLLDDSTLSPRLQSAEPGSFLFDYQGHLLDFDDAARKLTGLRPAALSQDLTLDQLFDFPTMRTGFAVKSLRRKAGKGKWIKARLARFNGSRFDVRVEIRPFSSHMLLVVSETGVSLAYLLAASVTSTTHGIACADPTGRIIYTNLPFLGRFGFGSPSELIGRNLWKILPVIEARDALEANAHTAQNWDGHFVACRKDGTPFDAYVSFLNMLDPEGNRAAIRVMVTERRRLFTEQHDGQTLRVIAESSFASVMLLNRSGVIQYCSPAAERISGYAPEERVGGTIFDLFLGPSREEFRKGFEELLDHPGQSKPFRLQLLRKDGASIWVEDTVTNLLDDPSVGAVVVTAYDVSKQIQAEEQARIQELAIEASIYGFVIADLTHRITYANAAYAGMLGYAKEELIGKQIVDLLASPQPDRLATIETAGHWSGPSSYRHRNGTIIVAQSSVSAVKDGEGRVLCYTENSQIKART